MTAGLLGLRWFVFVFVFDFGGWWLGGGGGGCGWWWQWMWATYLRVVEGMRLRIKNN